MVAEKRADRLRGKLEKRYGEELEARYEPLP